MIRKRTFCCGNETRSRISRRKCVHESSGNPAGLLLPGTYAYLLVVFIKRMSVYYLWFILFTLLRSISESMNENIKIGSSFNSFIFIYADSDSSRTPSPPHHLHITLVVVARHLYFQRVLPRVNWRLHLIMRRSEFYVGVLDVEAPIEGRGVSVVRMSPNMVFL